MDTLTVLSGARKLISKPDAWLKGVTRGWLEGGTLIPTGRWETSNCFCAVGAIREAAGNDEKLSEASEGEILDTIGSISWLWSFNDKHSTTHKDVLAAFDATIARLDAP